MELSVCSSNPSASCQSFPASPLCFSFLSWINFSFPRRRGRGRIFSCFLEYPLYLLILTDSLLSLGGTAFSVTISDGGWPRTPGLRCGDWNPPTSRPWVLHSGVMHPALLQLMVLQGQHLPFPLLSPTNLQFIASPSLELQCLVHYLCLYFGSSHHPGCL